MCYREVQCTRHACGHDHPQSDCRVDCGSANCRYSLSHNPACPPKNCSYTCKQWLKPARTVVSANSSLHCRYCRSN
ncbi:hypothetical protein B0H34DRAFT_737140 [Crassisporium funariophilum]|nr:hypothetical protein B0H34DRAFT_737140 [Crassisporium funariophilum]